MDKQEYLSASFEGALWKILSMACFACINGIVRYISGGSGHSGDVALPVHVIMFFQNLFGVVFLLPWISRSGIGVLNRANNGLHALRILTAVLGVYLWYLTLEAMPVAEGVALSFTGPVITVVCAWFVLHEKMDLQRVLAIVLCLFGAFLIARPDIPFTGGEHPIGMSAVLPLSSAVFLAFSKLATRKLSTLGEDSSKLALYLLVFMTPASLILAVFDWVTPSSTHLGWLLLLGFLASVAHLSFAKAYRLADVTFLTPFGFTKFLLSALVAYLAFSELSTSVGLWVGAVILGASVCLLGCDLSSILARLAALRNRAEGVVKSS